MAGTEEVTLASSRHLPAAEIATHERARMQERARLKKNARIERSSGARPRGGFCTSAARLGREARVPNTHCLHPRGLVSPDAGNQTRPKGLY